MGEDEIRSKGMKILIELIASSLSSIIEFLLLGNWKIQYEEITSFLKFFKGFRERKIYFNSFKQKKQLRIR